MNIYIDYLYISLDAFIFFDILHSLLKNGMNPRLFLNLLTILRLNDCILQL